MKILPWIAGMVLVTVLGTTTVAQSSKHVSARISTKLVPWRFQEDFHTGIPSWISFPLSQDVGYDPSIYTIQLEGNPVLVRNAISRGEENLRVGVLRQLHFLATPASVFEITYRLEMGGTITRTSFLVASDDGKKYETTLSVDPGKHTERISGERLHVPASGVQAEAIVIETLVSRPVRGSENRLTIQSFRIDGQQQPAVTIRSPQMAHSQGSGIEVAREVITRGKPAKIEFDATTHEGTLEIIDGSGTVTSKTEIPAGANRVAIPKTVGFHPGMWMARIVTGETRSEFLFLVAGDTPAHPRLLLTKERLERLKSYANSKELKTAVHQRAAKLAASIAMNPDAGDNIALESSVSPFASLPQYFNLMENYSNAIGYNAVDFRLTGDRKALEVTRQALLTMSKWKTWTPTWWPAHGLHTYYEVGVATQRIALGYDLVADELTSEERSVIIGALWRNSIQPTLDDYFSSDRIPIAASNHEAQSVGGAIAAVVAAYGDVPEWNDRLGAALAELTVSYDRLLDGLFPGDGSEAEPGGYQNFAMEGLSWGIAGLNALGIHPSSSDKMEQSFWWLRYVRVSRDVFLDTGDFDGQLEALSGFAWGAESSGDPALRAFYDAASKESVAGLFQGLAESPIVADTGRALEEAPGLLDLVCCSQANPAPPVSPPPSRLFSKRGSAALRSGWGPQDTVISIRVGAWFNHEHHDQGSFQVAAFGERLLAEAGYTDYYHDPHYADYFIEAPGHNTVLLNGNPFSQKPYDGRYWRAFQRYPKFTGHMFSAGIDYVAADLAAAYGGELSKFSREYLFLKPDILIVHDRLASSKPQRYDWLLHVPAGLEVSQNGSDAVIRGKSASAVITIGSPDLHFLVESVPIPNSEYSDLDRHQVVPRQQMRLSSPQQTEADFLVGMRFTDAPPENSALHPLTTTSAEGFTATSSTGKWSLLFRKQNGPLTSGDISTDGDVLAVLDNSGATQIFASGARYLRDKQQELISSNLKVTFVLQETPGQDDLQVTAAKACSLRILAQKTPVETRLDGQQVPIQFSGGFVFVNVAGGEHRVSIRY
ncbi:MAG: heparinase II/III domain-containing protein [Candidatus Acidiferrales bacterium]